MRHGAMVAALVVAGAMAGAAMAQQALRAADLVGVWRGYDRTGEMVIASEVIFFADGHYQRVNVLGQLMNYVTGDYRLAGNWVHFQPTDYEPKVYLGIPQYAPPSETWVVDGFDGHRLHATSGSSELAFERYQ